MFFCVKIQMRHIWMIFKHFDAKAQTNSVKQSQRLTVVENHSKSNIFQIVKIWGHLKAFEVIWGHFK